MFQQGIRSTDEIGHYTNLRPRYPKTPNAEPVPYPFQEKPTTETRSEEYKGLLGHKYPPDWDKLKKLNEHDFVYDPNEIEDHDEYKNK